MKDELIDNLNAKIERNRRLSTSVLNLLGINKFFTLMKSFKQPDISDFDEADSIKNFLKSFS